MPRRNRRIIIGFATAVLGASGFVASGAVDVKEGGSLGDNWIQVAGVEQSVTFSSLGQAGGEGSSSGEATGSEGTARDDDRATDAIDDTDAGTGSSTLVSTSVEVPVDPAAANSLNSAESAICDGSLFETAAILRRLTNTCVESLIVN